MSFLRQADPIRIGDKIRFDSQGGKWWWDVRALDDRYLIATQQQAFACKGELIYTVVDSKWNITYNGVPPGMARSSLNTLGGGWPFDHGVGYESALETLRAGYYTLSRRRILAVNGIEVKAR